VNIIGIDFPCLVENEVNSINIGRIQDLIKGCTELQKIPILGDIPLLGKLFRHSRKTKDSIEMLMLVRATVV